MMRSLFSGVSGLTNQQIKMDVIGNNIANINTIGFKGSRVQFAEELSQVLRGARDAFSRGSQNSVAVGLGVRTSSIDRNFTQGLLQSTGQLTDVGIDGDGLFVVSDGARQLYTRAGSFSFDSQGRLVAPNGFLVQGFMADANGEVSQTASPENILFDSSVISPAKATENVAIAGNLDATAAQIHETWTASKALTVAATGAPAVGTTELNDLEDTTTPLVDGDVIIISGTNPDGSAVSGTFTYGAGNDGTTVADLLASINAAYTDATATLDSTGEIVISDDNAGESQLTISLAQGTSNTGSIALPSFVNSANGLLPQTSADIVVYDSLGVKHTMSILFTKTANPREWSFQASLNGSEVIQQGSSGTLTFRADGSLETFIPDSGQSLFVFDPDNGAEPVSINLDFENAAGFSSLTQSAGPSTVHLPFQDGQAQGTLTDFAIDESGRILGTFSNGRNRLIAQLALAKVSNPDGLTHVGNNLYDISASSGIPVVGKAGEEVASSIISGTLEASNVNLSEEFTQMIIAQRAFQANARVITVSDQFLGEVTQLKR